MGPLSTCVRVGAGHGVPYLPELEQGVEWGRMVQQVPYQPDLGGGRVGTWEPIQPNRMTDTLENIILPRTI